MRIRMVQCALTLSVLALSLFNGCGGHDASASLSNSFSNLSQLPSAAEMVAGSGSNGATFPNATHFINNGISLQSVQGTAPLLSALTSSTSDTYFWNGLVATLVALGGAASSTQKNQFWGQDTSTPGPGGHGACNMAMSVMESLGRMLDAASTQCYMKGISAGPTGVSVTGSSAGDMFKQNAGDKVVKVAVSGMENGRASMNVFFKVYGTGTVGGDIYKYDLWMCQSGSVSSLETLTVNKSTGVMTSTGSDGRGSDVGTNSITAYLTVENGAIKFDKSKNRTANSTYHGSWGDYKGQITILPGDIIAGRRYNVGTYSGQTYTDKTFSLAAFSGTSFDNFRFLQAAYKGLSSGNGQSRTYSGITEFRNTFYASVASSDLSVRSEYTGEDLTSDTFFTSLTTPTFDASAYSCATSADITATMDFTQAAVLAIQTGCDGEKNKMGYSSMCDSDNIRVAMNKTWSR